MYEWKTLPAARWLPDQPDLGSPGNPVARNVIPAANGYTPLSATATATIALPSTSSADYAKGGFSLKDDTNTFYTFAGDSGNLYQASATGWATVSKAGGYSGTGTDYVWKFAQWGNTCLATNFLNPIQTITLGGASFADLGGSPPRCKYLGVVGDFVVAGYLYESSTTYPRRSRWSGFNNNTLWTPSQATQSDFQDFPDGDSITGFHGGEYGVFFQENAIRRMNRVSDGRIFTFDVVTRSHGCKLPGSICQYGGLHFYISDQDFMVFDGASQPQGLGAEKVFRYFIKDMDVAYTNRMSAKVDARRQVVMWAYAGYGNSGGIPNRLIMFSLVNKEFSVADVEAGFLFDFAPSSATTDSLDNISTDVDTMAQSLDSPLFSSQFTSLGAFNRNNRVFTFTGQPMDAEIDTAELRMEPSGNLEITSVRGLVEGGSYTAQVGHRSDMGSSATWTSQITPNSNGECSARVNNKFVRVKIRPTGAWKYVQGADLKIRKAGHR